MAFVRQVLVIMAKDLRAELRTKEAINASLSFALVVLLLFSFAFDPSEETTREISGGLLWIVFAFAGTLLLNRSFARELGNDCLDALISAPIPGSALFLGKALANYVLVLAVELIALPLFGVFYNVRWTSQFWQLMLETPPGPSMSPKVNRLVIPAARTGGATPVISAESTVQTSRAQVCVRPGRHDRRRRSCTRSSVPLMCSRAFDRR